MTGPDPDGTPDRTGSTGTLSRVARRRESARPVAGRTAALVAVATVLLGVATVSALAPPPKALPAPPAGDGVAVAPVDAHASSFFCTTGAGTDAGAGATATVVLTNTTRSPATGLESAVTQSAGPVLTRLTVPALGSVVVNPAAGLPAGASASSFSFASGGVTGTAVVAGPQGWSTAPCVTQVSPVWDFAGGSTAGGLLDLSLYNPTAAPAVVDVTFLTSSGTVLDPQAYQGIALAPGQLVVEGLGAYVQNQPVVGTLVESTSGAVVATELDQMAVPSGSGLALLRGSPGPSTTWRFAQTTAVAGGTVALDVANPATSSVVARVTVSLPGATVLPHDVTVPARTVVTFPVSSVAGWPLGSPYALSVTAPSPVIVGRTVVAPAGGASPQGGIAGGTTATASAVLVVAPGAPGSPAVTGASIRSLAVANPGKTPVDVTVTPLGGGTPLARTKVPAGGVVVLGTGQVGGLRPLRVAATGPVTVEADDAPTGAPGIVSSSGFALPA
ncbi:MAG TPA: DUF5719 family protein [Acidimicrobiales bacterium]|nr:DUF5719 family protein [Acidimicrobiales bacterium]